MNLIKHSCSLFLFLISFFYISCGKDHPYTQHQEFFNDINESRNQDLQLTESKNLEEIKGHLRFHFIDEFDFELSNFLSLEEQIWGNFLSDSATDVSPESFHILSIKPSNQRKIFNDYLKNNVNESLQNNVSISFDFNNASSKSGKYLVFSHQKSKKRLTRISENISFKLTFKEINMLLSKEAFLSIEKDPSMILDRTDKMYKTNEALSHLSSVFILQQETKDEAKKISLLKLSKDIHPEDLFKLLNIENPLSLTRDQVFLGNIENNESLRWFYKKLTNGDIVMIKSDFLSIQKKLPNFYQSTKLSFERIDGQNKSQFPLTKDNIILKLRPAQKTIRNFTTTHIQKTYDYGGGGGVHGNATMPYNCTHQLTKLSGETVVEENMSDTLKNMTISSNFLNISLYEWKNKQVSVGRDDNGEYFNVILYQVPTNSTLLVSSPQNSPQTIIGEISNSCKNKKRYNPLASQQKMNNEKKLLIEVNLYIEKKVY